MFKSLIDTVSSLLPSKPEFLYQPDLHDISAALLAYSRYQETGDFLIVDHLLEQRIAPEILARESIFDMSNFLNAVPNIEEAYSNSKNLSMEKIFPKYIDMFRGLNES